MLELAVEWPRRHLGGDSGGGRSIGGGGGATFSLRRRVAVRGTALFIRGNQQQNARKSLSSPGVATEKLME